MSFREGVEFKELVFLRYSDIIVVHDVYPLPPFPVLLNTKDLYSINPSSKP